MQIRMKTTAAGPKFHRPAGSVHEVEDAEAQDLIDGGYAEAVEPAASESEGEADADRPAKKARRTKGEGDADR